MSTLNSRDKAILEKVLRMEQGWLLDFSDRTMQNFFLETFKINIYDEKYDFDFPSKSKVNRLRGIWRAESDEKVGSIILALVDYAEVIVLTKEEELAPLQKELFQKAKDIGSRLLNTQSVQKETVQETDVLQYKVKKGFEAFEDRFVAVCDPTGKFGQESVVFMVVITP